MVTFSGVEGTFIKKGSMVSCYGKTYKTVGSTVCFDPAHGGYATTTIRVVGLNWFEILWMRITRWFRGLLWRMRM